ncbi:hypothetical protein GLOIN_2v1768207 [Rhizophagus clarus]|uniref:Ion transport domain-containing protein n=1 Tax=Rhizophagus clarus TaxID=94130 RepID=A0A8H3M9T9_9GLOM|nr:hypothetical protein GLOIN_2v1768207 [Rhizophagus clarus]
MSHIEVDKIEIEVDKNEAKVDKNEAKVDKNEAKIDKIEDEVDKIEVKVDKTEIEVDKINDKLPHKGKLITNVELSPDGKYLVSYSEKDFSIAGWNIENANYDQPKPELHIELYYHVEPIFDMMNKCQKIKLDCNLVNVQRSSFNLKGELILFNKRNHIHIYSTQIKNNKWKRERKYKIPKGFKLISMSKCDDKVYLFSNNSIYEWNLITKKSKKILSIDDEIKYYKDDDLKEYIEKNISISSDEKFVCLKYKDKIIIFSVELEIPIASLDMNIDNQLRMFMKNLVLHHLLLPLFPLLFPLFSNVPNNEFWGSVISVIENCEGKYLINSKQFNRLPEILLPNNIRVTCKYAFGILEGDIWMIDIKKVISNINYLFKSSDELNNANFDEIFENLYFDNDNQLNIPFNLQDINFIPKLFEEAMVDKNKIKNEKLELELTQNLIKWEISSYLHDNYNIKLQVFKNINDDSGLNLTCIRVENFKSQNYYYLHGIKSLNDSDIIILTGIGLLIYHFNENDVSICLNYFYHFNENNESICLNYPYYMDTQIYFHKIEHYYKEVFSKHALPLPNYDSLKLCNGSVSNIKDNRKLLLKYGVEFLANAIKEHNLELIDGIYKKCIMHFKEDLRNNNTTFLSIITSTMPLLNIHYPEYITKYSLETSMIIDSPVYNIESLNDNLHLCSFQYPQIINLTKSTLRETYEEVLLNFKNNHKIIYWILAVIQILIILLFSPVYFTALYILCKFTYINHTDLYGDFVFCYFYIVKHVKNLFLKFSKDRITPTIIFMNSYIKFVNYPQEYNWFFELIKPQSSPFIKTINRDIYKTWSGESLINFKWNAYGKYYYTMIWIGFMALLGCFTAAATIPQQYISNDIQKQLLVASIALGFIHLNFEIRQFIHDPIKWISDFWNLFDIIAFLLPIYTSIYWLQTNIRNIHLLSFTCLFLDIKFLLFFRVFESFGIYFAIIISVGKQIIYFLVVLLIIIISFAHALYILLSPENNVSFEKYTYNNDPNNPWNIAPAYHQVFENGTFDPNPYMIQQPDGNTNMFLNFRTALFAMYLFLTGDSSALTNWTYIDNPSLAIMIVLFSLLIVVYLMNLFIGLLNNAIEKDNNRISYLIQKAEIIAEIELFYLLPFQRRWKPWFPEVLYYYANVDKTREKVKEMMSKGEWNSNEFPELRKDLLKKLNIQPVDETSLQQLLNEVQDIRENSLHQLLEVQGNSMQKLLKVHENSLRQLLEVQENSMHQLLKEIHIEESK